MIGTCLHCSTEFEYNPSHKMGKYCNNDCQQLYQHQQTISAWLNEGIVPGVKVLRRYFYEKDYSCSECGISDWNGKELRLELDHIDGDSTNNLVENLRLLCPNCHSQTPTYKAKNIGRGRKNRYLHTTNHH
jgi:5-methylcytosine-specific restriction endonuclease McrA